MRDIFEREQLPDTSPIISGAISVIIGISVIDDYRPGIENGPTVTLDRPKSKQPETTGTFRFDEVKFDRLVQKKIAVCCEKKFFFSLDLLLSK